MTVGQLNRGTITGTVTAIADASISKVKLTARNTGTDALYDGITNDAGQRESADSVGNAGGFLTIGA